MRVGLFIPCYIDQLYPQVGMATLRLLEHHDVEVDYPREQTCCGQPLANSGYGCEAARLARRFVDVFADYEHVVCPSASCVSMVRHQLPRLVPRDDRAERVSARTFELCELLVDVLGVDRIEGRFEHRVGLLQSCQGLRELRLASSSERVGERFDKVRQLIGSMEGIELVTTSRSDECCGFGGTFAVVEEAVSCMMGNDRIADFQQAGAEVITGTDMSCLMHLGGLIARAGAPLRVMHVAEILAGGAA